MSREERIAKLENQVAKLQQELEGAKQKIIALTADKQELEPYANIGKAYVELDKVAHVQKFRNPFIYAVKQMERLNNNQDKE